MNEAKLADLNEIQDFFNRVDRPSVEPIGVKDFIGWCNNPYKNDSNRTVDDQANVLGQTVRSLNCLNEDRLMEMKSALKEGRWNEWLKNNGIKASPEDVVFYLALKHRTDSQGHYRFYFDKDSVAEIDAFNPFKDNTTVLDQQWHVPISLLAFRDVAHALSNERHECHCLYQHIKDWDKGDLNALELRFSRYASGTIELQLRSKGKNWQRQPSSAMNEWLRVALCRP